MINNVMEVLFMYKFSEILNNYFINIDKYEIQGIKF